MCCYEESSKKLWIFRHQKIAKSSLPNCSTQNVGIIFPTTTSLFHFFIRPSVIMQQLKAGLFVLAVSALLVVVASQSTAPMPPPFTRVLTVQSPPLHGNDVVILQNLIVRSSCVTLANMTGNYDTPTANAVTSFQQCNKLTGVKAGVFDSITANVLLTKNSCDGIIDSGVPVGPQGYKYKVLI